MFDNFHTLLGLYRTMGPLRFAIFFGGILGFCVGFAALGIWLADQIGWPEAYGFRCYGRGCWIDNLWHSPQLLKDGNGYALALFALIWSLPGAAGLATAFVVIRRWWKRRRNRIRPMD